MLQRKKVSSRNRLPARVAGCAAMIFLCLDAAKAEDVWPQFRGPAAGVAEDAALPESWSATSNVAWKLDIPGRGWSSPVVAGDRIFLTSVIATQPEEPPKKGLVFRRKPRGRASRRAPLDGLLRRLEDRQAALGA